MLMLSAHLAFRPLLITAAWAKLLADFNQTLQKK